MDYIVNQSDAEAIVIMVGLIVMNAIALGFCLGNMSGQKRVIRMLQNYMED